MIKDSAKVKIYKEYNKLRVSLKEPQCEDSTLVINNLPEESIVIKADEFKSPSSLFKGENGELKRADYIIVSETDDDKVVLFIELKKTKDKEEEIIKQLKGSYCLFFYLKQIGIEFWDNDDFLSGYRYRFISFGHTSIRKNRTIITVKGKIHDKSENMMKINWPNYTEFNKIAGTKH